MNTKPDTSRRHGCQIFACGGQVLLLVILTPLLAFLLLSAMGGFLIVADPLARADALVLLSGGDTNRADEAVSIYKEKYANTFILTNTGEEVADFNTTYVDMMRFELMGKGIPSGAILVTEGSASSTMGEAKAVQRLLGPSKVSSLIVVTDPYHTRRAQLYFQKIFENEGVKIIVRPVRGSWYRSTTWWMSARGWEATISEYTKLFGYYIQKEMK